MYTSIMPMGRMRKVYDSRNFRRNSAASKLQRFIRKRRSAGAQSAQLVKTNKRINRIQSKLRSEVNRYGLVHETTAQLYADTVVMIQPAFVAGANSPNWVNCFANSDAAINVNRVRLGRAYLRMQFTASTEDAPITTSLFHVRLNPKNAQWLISDLGTGLTPMVDKTHYVRGTAGILAYASNTNGSVMLNPDYFVVKRQWHFTLGGSVAALVGTATSNLTNTVKNIDYSFPLGYTVGKGRSNWQSVSADDDTAPELKNYILVFTNNSLADLQSNSFSILQQCTATAIE